MSETKCEYNLKTSAGVVAFLKTTTIGSADDWHKKVERVKEANGGLYPNFWHKDVLQAGIYSLVMSSQCAGCLSSKYATYESKKGKRLCADCMRIFDDLL
jgi:hypothetical protein